MELRSRKQKKYQINKIKEVVKYLVYWKRFTAKNDIQKREKDLENTKETVAEFEERLSIEMRKQKYLDLVEERDIRKGKLPEKYMVKILYRQNDKKLEKN